MSGVRNTSRIGTTSTTKRHTAFTFAERNAALTLKRVFAAHLCVQSLNVALISAVFSLLSFVLWSQACFFFFLLFFPLHYLFAPLFFLFFFFSSLFEWILHLLLLSAFLPHLDYVPMTLLCSSDSFFASACFSLRLHLYCAWALKYTTPREVLLSAGQMAHVARMELARSEEICCSWWRPPCFSSNLMAGGFSCGLFASVKLLPWSLSLLGPFCDDRWCHPYYESHGVAVSTLWIIVRLKKESWD